MNQAELIERVAQQGLTPKDAKVAVQTVFATIEAAVASGDSVRTPLGVFSLRERAARKGRNPQTGEAVKVPASKSVKLRTSAGVKERMNSSRRKKAAKAPPKKAADAKKAGPKRAAAAASAAPKSPAKSRAKRS